MTEREIKRLVNEALEDAAREAADLPRWWDDASYARWQGDPHGDETPCSGGRNVSAPLPPTTSESEILSDGMPF